MAEAQPGTAKMRLSPDDRRSNGAGDVEGVLGKARRDCCMRRAGGIFCLGAQVGPRARSAASHALCQGASDTISA